jgi:hypothetical protein
MRQPLFAAMILLAGSLLAGLGFCLLLPPFEGFDETAHYGYIQQIAQTGTWPRLNDPMPAEVAEYLKVAPSSRARGGRWSYPDFFAESLETIRAGAMAVHGDRDPARPWRAGAGTNWESHHPPLYYAVLAPVWSVSKAWSVHAQLVLLRSVSYLLAWGGLVVATISIARAKAAAPLAPLLVVAPALWPALFPMWFPEMARLGNDSLVLLLLAAAWVVTGKAIGPGGTSRHFALLGAICGLGLLTKATMLPFIAALGLFLTWRAWHARGDGVALRRSLAQLLVLCLVTAAISGWWYARNLLDTGDVLGSFATIALERQGGLLKGLSEKFLLLKATTGLGATAMTFLWVGTWSATLPPRLLEIPLAILVVVLAAGWISRAAQTRQICSLDAIALLTLVLFVAALLWQTLIFIVLMAVYSGSAWYLHSLAPLLAPMVGRGLAEAATWRRARPLVSALLVYPLLFLPFATALQLFHYAGCLAPPILEPHVGLSAAATCAAAPRELLDHLAVLGSPALGLALFGAGWLAMLIGVAVVIAQAIAAAPPAGGGIPSPTDKARRSRSGSLPASGA